MSDEIVNVTGITEELIDVPEYMSEDYGVATADTCGSVCESVQGSCPNACQSAGQACSGTCQGYCEFYGQSTCQLVCMNCQGNACLAACQSGQCSNIIAQCGQIPSCGVCQLGGQCGACMTTSQRPSNWTWTSTVSKGTTVSNINGSPAYLTAVEWNDFTARINLFRTYKGLSTVTFTAAVTGEPMQAAQFNAARTAINDMSPPSPVPSVVTAGSSILASVINGLSAALNSIT